MRPLLWTELATLALISAALASPVLAQTTPPGELGAVATEQTPGEPATPGNTAAPFVIPVPAYPVAVDPPPSPPNPNVVRNPVWLQQPSAQDFARHYPEGALAANMEGRATIDCLVEADGRLSCTVTAEDPPGLGFGEATLRISREYRLASETSDGIATAGKRLRRTIRWRMPQQR